MKIQKILNVIIIVALIIVIGIVGMIIYDIKVQSKETSKEISEQKEIETVNKEIDEKQENETEENPEEEYIGQEESNRQDGEDTTKTIDEKVIELAKEKWGEDNSVTFSIEEKKENLYYVAVKSNAKVISWYEVNINTWEISDFY